MKLHYRGFRHESNCVEFAKMSHSMDPEYAMSSKGYSRAVHCDYSCLAAEEKLDQFLVVQVFFLIQTHFCSISLPVGLGETLNPLLLADESFPSIENLPRDPFLAERFGLGMYCHVGEFVGEDKLSPLISRQVAVGS
jgi:hypothetical protein